MLCQLCYEAFATVGRKWYNESALRYCIEFPDEFQWILDLILSVNGKLFSAFPFRYLSKAANDGLCRYYVQKKKRRYFLLYKFKNQYLIYTIFFSFFIFLFPPRETSFPLQKNMSLSNLWVKLNYFYIRSMDIIIWKESKNTVENSRWKTPEA